MEEIPPANLIFMQSVHHIVKEKMQQASSFPYEMFKKRKKVDCFCLRFQNKWHSTEIQRLEVLGYTQTKLTVRARECTILS